jgi:hypothetical protein
MGLGVRCAWLNGMRKGVAGLILYTLGEAQMVGWWPDWAQDTRRGWGKSVATSSGRRSWPDGSTGSDLTNRAGGLKSGMWGPLRQWEREYAGAGERLTPPAHLSVLGGEVGLCEWEWVGPDWGNRPTQISHFLFLFSIYVFYFEFVFLFQIIFKSKLHKLQVNTKNPICMHSIIL